MSYSQTHPWITFSFNLKQADYKLWILLGEVQSKCEHIAGIPLLPKVAERLHEIYLAKGVLATTAIEGNTLTEDEVMKRLEGKLELPPSKEYLGKEIDNVVNACNLIKNQVFSKKEKKITYEDIKNFNQLILQNLPLTEEVVPGEIRKHPVGVARYKAVDPQDCEFLLKKLCSWLNEKFNPPHEFPKEYSISFSILKAIAAHIYLAWIHPFGDGNGRTARLVEFKILLTTGVPSAAAHLLSNHYNQTRQEYYRQLDQTSKSGGNIIPFVEYAVQGFVDGLKEQIGEIRKQQLEVHWKNYVYEKFKDKNNPSDTRRRHLVLDLSDKEEGVSLSEIRHISPRIAEAYAIRTLRTLSRDVENLLSMGLIKRTNEGRLKAKKEVILAFLVPSLNVQQNK